MRGALQTVTSRAMRDLHGTAQQSSNLTTLASLRFTSAQSRRLFLEVQVYSTATRVLVTAPMELANSVVCISSGVIYQSTIQMNGSSQSLIRFVSSHIFSRFSTDSASPFVQVDHGQQHCRALQFHLLATPVEPRAPRHVRLLHAPSGHSNVVSRGHARTA